MALIGRSFEARLSYFDNALKGLEKRMKLVYVDSGKEVKVGDSVTMRDGFKATVDFYRKPHKPSSEGKVTLRSGGGTQEFYVSVIGAEWINRTDRF